MGGPVLFSIVASPMHPGHASLFSRMGLEEVALTTTRKALSQLKKQVPDVVLADFVYGFSNNYSGVHISNLDVFLMSMQKFAPGTPVIVLAAPEELEYAEKMRAICPIQAIHPFTVPEAVLERELEAALAQR